MENLFKALSDGNRLRILHLLTHRELCVCEIEEILETTQSNASRHLLKLKHAGVISSTKKAQWVYYHLSADFAGSHSLLHQYLKGIFESEEIYRRDLEALDAFVDTRQSCKTLA